MTEEKSVAIRENEQPKTPVIFEESKGLIPKDFDGLWQVSSMIAKSGLAPKGLQSPAAIATAIQFGAEIGLSIMGSLQNISVINGRPSVWGDAPLGLVQVSPDLEEFKEEEVGTYPNKDYGWKCTVKRKGRAQVVRSYTVADAQDAGLWFRGLEHPSREQQYTPWFRFPKRMLQMRARSWTLRDSFPDKLKGIAIGEEFVGVENTVELIPDESGSFEKKAEGAASLEAKLKNKPLDLEQTQKGDRTEEISDTDADLGKTNGKPDPVEEPEGKTKSDEYYEQAYDEDPKNSHDQKVKKEQQLATEFKSRVFQHFADLDIDKEKTWKEVDEYTNYCAEKTNRTRGQIEELALESQEAFANFMDYFGQWKMEQDKTDPDEPVLIRNLNRRRENTKDKIDPTHFDRYKNKRKVDLVIEYFKTFASNFFQKPDRLAEAKEWFERRFPDHKFPLSIDQGEGDQGNEPPDDPYDYESETQKADMELVEAKAQIAAIKDEDPKGLAKACQKTGISMSPPTIGGCDKLLEAYWDMKRKENGV